MRSCLHKWNKIGTELSQSEYCVTCGATCVRENGAIVEYDRVAGYGNKQDSDVRAYRADNTFDVPSEIVNTIGSTGELNGHNHHHRNSRR